MKKSTSILQPTLADAFEVGKKEGLKEAFSEIKNILDVSTNYDKNIKIYIEARLKSIQDFTLNNPFKQKDMK